MNKASVCRIQESLALYLPHFRVYGLEHSRSPDQTTIFVILRSSTLKWNISKRALFNFNSRLYSYETTWAMCPQEGNPPATGIRGLVASPVSFYTVGFFPFYITHHTCFHLWVATEMIRSDYSGLLDAYQSLCEQSSASQYTEKRLRYTAEGRACIT